jgi:hypothetical protein
VENFLVRVVAIFGPSTCHAQKIVVEGWGSQIEVFKNWFHVHRWQSGENFVTDLFHVLCGAIFVPFTCHCASHALFQHIVTEESSIRVAMFAPYIINVQLNSYRMSIVTKLIHVLRGATFVPYINHLQENVISCHQIVTERVLSQN